MKCKHIPSLTPKHEKEQKSESGKESVKYDAQNKRQDATLA